MTVREIFRQNLRYYRKLNGLTQEALSEKIGLNPKYITNIESQMKFPSPETIDAIVDVLKINPAQLFENQGCPVNALQFNKEVFTENLISSISGEVRNAIEKHLAKIN